MPVKLTPEEYAEVWASRLGASVDRIRSGVDRVTEAPGKRAAASVDRFRARILDAIDSGRWGAEVSKVPLETWKALMKEKGVPRIASGANAARPQMAEFARELFSHIERGQAELERMPHVTLDDSINRATAWIRHMAGFTWKGAG